MAKTNNSGGGAGPFVIALAVAVLILVGVVAVNMLSADEEPTDSVQIQKTAGQYYGALNNGRYQDLVDNTCKKNREAADFPKSAGFEEARQQAVKAEGERKIASGDDFKNLVVDGNRASARITLTYDKGDPKRTAIVDATFVREDGKWKMCL